MEIIGARKQDAPMTLDEEHKWIEYCRHIPVEAVSAEVSALQALRSIILQITQYNNDCGACGKESIVQFPLEISCVTSKRGRLTLDPAETIDYINTRLVEIGKEKIK